MRVFVIGLDGASPTLIERWKDQLPNLNRIMRNGVSGILESSDPPITSPAWNCFATGKNPGKIGIFDFVNLTKDWTTRIVDHTMQDSLDLWEILSNYGKKVGIINVPVTYPPKKVNGFMISGFPTPLSAADYAFPHELKAKLDKLVDGYETGFALSSPKYMKGGQEGFIRDVYRVHSKIAKATTFLMKDFSCDFFMVVFTALDVIQHFFWHYMDTKHPDYDLEDNKRYGNVIKAWYIEIDKTVGKLMRLLGEETYMLIMSDHGAGPLYHVLFINEWLKKHGFLKLKSKNSRNPVEVTSYVLSRLKGFMFRYFGSPSIRKILPLIPKRLLLRVSHVGSIKQDIDSILKLIDWSQSVAFAFGGLSPNGRIHINVRRSEIRKKYGEIRDEIAEKLQHINLELGGDVRIDIHTKEEVYWGKYSHIAPDIIFYLLVNGIICETSPEIGCGTLLGRHPIPGGHAKEGFWALVGPNVRKNRKINAKIIDLAPTILHLSGVPIPSDMDGQVIGSAFEQTGAVRFVEPLRVSREEHAYSKKEQEEIRKRLKGLGYI